MNVCPARAMMSKIGDTSGLERTVRILTWDTPLYILEDALVKSKYHKHER